MTSQSVQLRCPACSARFRGARFCSRCGADLGPLMLIATKAQILRTKAHQAFSTGNLKEAALWAHEAEELHATPKSKQLVALMDWLLFLFPEHLNAIHPSPKP